MPTKTIGGSRDTELNAVTVAPMSSRPSRTVTTTTPVAKQATASVNSVSEITRSVDLPVAREHERAADRQPEPGRRAAQRPPGIEPGLRGRAVLARLGGPQPLQRRHVRIGAHRRVGGHPGLLAGDVDGMVEPAELVDEPARVRVGTGPHPAAGHVLDPIAGEITCCGDLGGEVVVYPVQDAVDPFQLGLGEVAGGA